MEVQTLYTLQHQISHWTFSLVGSNPNFICTSNFFISGSCCNASLSLSILFSILSCCSFSSLSSLKLFSVLTPVEASSFLCCMAHMFLTMFPTLFFWKPQYLLNVSLQYAVSDVFSLLSYPLALEGKNTSLVGFDIKTTGSNCDILLYSIKTFTNSNFSPK